MEEYASIGLDALVGSVGNGSTLRLISDVRGVTYTEGRFLPYFFPDTFHDGGDPVREAAENWVTARRAIMRSPIDRIGYGGYLKLALAFPDFIDYIAQVCDEFRELYDTVKADFSKPYCSARVAVLNCWGKMRSWGCHMVHHALYQKQNYSYAGVIEILSGAPYDVHFISFDDILENPEVLAGFDVLVNIGDTDTAHSGGAYWRDERIVAAVRGFIADGGGFIGVGEPSGHQWQGRTLQLAAALGVEKENGFTLGYDKYNWDEKSHFIVSERENETSAIDFGEGAKGIYALPETAVLVCRDKEVQLAANQYENGRTVYIGGLPYSAENARLLHRALLWSAGKESALKTWFSENPQVDVHAYPKSGRYAVCNNSYEPQSTLVYDGSGSQTEVELKGGELLWLKNR
jgi:1,3-beta-galactosyl-N-acetylhexosamine phosphorylase